MKQKKYSPELIEEIVDEVVRRIKEGFGSFKTVDPDDPQVRTPSGTLTTRSSSSGKVKPIPKRERDPKDRPKPLERVRKGQMYGTGNIDPIIGV